MGLFSRPREAPLNMNMRFHSVVTWERGHVSVAVLKLGEGTAEMLGVASAPVQGVGGTTLPDLDRWHTACERALVQAEDMTAQFASRKIVANHATMSVPIEVTRDLAVTVAQRRRNPTRSITLDEIASLLRRGYRMAQDSLETRARASTEDIVHGAVARVVVDGQTVLDPLDMYGEEVQLHLSFYLTPLEWIRALETVCERLQVQLVAIVPHHVAYASPVAEPLALMILLDERQSALGLVRRGHVEWGARAALGAADIMEGATAGLNLSERQVHTLMRAYRAGQFREDFELQLARAFWSELRRWMATLAEQALKAGQGQPFPHRIFFCDMTHDMPEARLSLGTPLWEHSLPFGRCPETVEMEIRGVQNVLDWTSHASGNRYLLLRSLAHLVARLYAPGNELDRALVETIHWRRTAPSAALRAR